MRYSRKLGETKKCGRNDICVTCFVPNFGKCLLIFLHLNEMSLPGWGLPWCPRPGDVLHLRMTPDDGNMDVVACCLPLPPTTYPSPPGFTLIRHPYSCLFGAPHPLVKGVWEPVPIMPHVCFPWGTEPLVPRVTSNCVSFPPMRGLSCFRYCAECLT